MPRGDLTFQNQIEMHLDDLSNKRLVISLLSGDRYPVDKLAAVTFLANFAVVMLSERDCEVFSPFEAICNVEVEHLAE